MQHRTARFLGVVAMTFCFQVSTAADQTSDSTRTPAAKVAADKLAEARSLIASAQWSAALDALRRVNDVGSAEWNNLMGYVLRKGFAPDLAAAEKYYDEALRIDPHHRNTLEYSGELYLMKGDLDKAKSRLATLAAECATTCRQYDDLNSAIERFKSAGMKVPSGSSW